MITEDWGEGERVGCLWLWASHWLAFQSAERMRTEGPAAGYGHGREVQWKRAGLVSHLWRLPASCHHLLKEQAALAPQSQAPWAPPQLPAERLEKEGAQCLDSGMSLPCHALPVYSE